MSLDTEIDSDTDTLTSEVLDARAMTRDDIDLVLLTQQSGLGDRLTRMVRAPGPGLAEVVASESGGVR